MNVYEQQVRTFYNEIWNKKNTNKIPLVLHKDFSFRGSLGLYKRGHAGFIEYLNLVHTALADYYCNIDDLVIQPGKVFAKMSFSGLHQAEFLGFPATHKQVSWSGAALFLFKGDKVIDLWVLGDLKGLEQQLEQ